MPMPEIEFAKLTLDQFKSMPDAQAAATLKRMSKDQFARWLDRAAPPSSRPSKDTGPAANAYALRRSE